jgi:hypothetical protein
MNRSFFPPWKELNDSKHISSLASPYFMGAVNRLAVVEGAVEYIPTTPSPVQTRFVDPPLIVKEEPIAKKPGPLGKTGGGKKEEVFLDWRYWAFWSAWISFHGLKEYESIPESQKMTFWIEEKTKMSQWFQDSFLLAKKEVGKHWDKFTNRDMEDAITGLVTDADEHEGGLKTLLLCWTYYSMTLGEKGERGEKGAVEGIWIVPSKSLYYRFSQLSVPEDTAGTPVERWGVFLELLEPKTNNRSSEKMTKALKPPPKQKRYSFRALKEGEMESIGQSMIEIKSVNRPLGAVSKYTLKELMEMGEKVGVRPPMLSSLDTKSEIALDLAHKIIEAEHELGVQHTPKEKKALKSESEKADKWKKGDWYERLEEYCLEAF